VNRVQLTPYRVVLAGVQTWPVDYEPLSKEISAVGFVEFNERDQRTVSARVAGRIDKLYANETGQLVNAGDDLALLYSPELLVTAQNLVEAKRNANRQLLEGARTRLELLGIDDLQINEILSAAKAETHLRIRSPISGHVIKKYVREGQYVEEGMPLYDVADLSTVWIQAQIYEDDLEFLPVEHERGWDPRQNLEVTATTRAYRNQVFQGKLAFVYPHVDQNTRTLTIRFELENLNHQLRPGSTANVTVKVKPADLQFLSSIQDTAERDDMLAKGLVLAVPESSVIDTGSQRIVYRQALPGVFDGVEVKLGPRMTGTEGAVYYPVLAGLQQGDRVVTSGSFLIDAETRLNPAAGSIYFGGSGGAHTNHSSRSTVRPSTPEDTELKIEASVAVLPSDDRQRAADQRFCAVLSHSRLGSMGTPVKLVIDQQAVFLCCSGCEEKALNDPVATLARVEDLKRAQASSTDR
jgi:Cu(I)/Ag(I) efflux system membrane fusion protein